jgi:hypothetical protein
MQLRQSSSNDKKEPEKTALSSNANTSTSNDDNSSHTAPPPNKRMALETPAVPVAQEKQPEQLNKQPMNSLMQMRGIEINASKPPTTDLKNGGKTTGASRKAILTLFFFPYIILDL